MIRHPPLEEPAERMGVMDLLHIRRILLKVAYIHHQAIIAWHMLAVSPGFRWDFHAMDTAEMVSPFLT